MKYFVTTVLIVLISSTILFSKFTYQPVEAGTNVIRCASELSLMVGYKIVDSTTIYRKSEIRSNKYVELLNGQVFKLNGLGFGLLMGFERVIVFKFEPSSEQKEILRQRQMPEALFSDYKLLIDDEIFSATLEKF